VRGGVGNSGSVNECRNEFISLLHRSIKDLFSLNGGLWNNFSLLLIDLGRFTLVGLLKRNWV